MKFEKVSEKTYNSFLIKSKGLDIEFQEQLDAYIKYFLDELKLPKRGTAFSAGNDFRCPVDVSIASGSKLLIPTGIKVQLDADKVLDVYPRSSLGTKHDTMMANTVGIIDSDYYNNEDNEGHILIMLKNTSDHILNIPQGDRFCQGIITQYFTVEGDEIGQGAKRVGGIGSTGTK
jgi:dUTP pyrophosphatase